MLRVSQRRLRPLPSLSAVTTVLSVGILIVALVMVGLGGTLALFTASQPAAANISAARIFRGERITPAFAVSDVSSGSASDYSSVTAFASDGRYFLTRTWPAAFDSARYVDLDLSSPLPGGLSALNVALTARLSSDAGTGSACVYLELRRASTNALLSSLGSAGSPLACTTGTQVTTLNVALAAVDATDIANDLRVRVFARDSGAGALRIDQATVGGDTPYAAFTLYPILTREQYSGQQELIRWSLAGP